MSKNKNTAIRTDLPYHNWVVFGAGGHGREVAWLIEQCWGKDIAICHVVDSSYLKQKALNEHPVHAFDSDLRVKNTCCSIAIGTPKLREGVYRRLAKIGVEYPPIIHPNSDRSTSVEIGNGAIIYPGTVITVNVMIGQHVHVNSNCTISHDVRIGDFSTLSPSVSISGHVHVGRRVFFGVGSQVINGKSNKPLKIGDDAIIAAGACVIRDVEAGSTVAGVPAVCKSKL